jgi:hypothetical protein
LGEGLNLSFKEQEICSGEELHGTLSITYAGRFDSVVISSQIENANEAFIFATMNGKKIKHPYSRISIFKSELPDPNNIDFSVITLHVPEGERSIAKFRATIIQEHKEVGADVVRVRVIKRG